MKELKTKEETLMHIMYVQLDHPRVEGSIPVLTTEKLMKIGDNE